MRLTHADAPELYLNIYNNRDTIPEGWVTVEFNLHKKKHKAALNSPRTNVIQILDGWGGTKKYPKPILFYATNTPEKIDWIKEHGDTSNAITFIYEI